jgi:hypothetical protein
MNENGKLGFEGTLQVKVKRAHPTLRQRVEAFMQQFRRIRG